MSRYSDLSKQIGWSAPDILDFPTRAQVERAFAARNDVQVFSWYRFLRSGQTADEIATMNYICECYAAMRTELERDQLADHHRIPLAKATR